MVAPAALLQDGRRGKVGEPLAARTACFRANRPTTKGASGKFRFGARMRKAILGDNRQSTTKRIGAKQRIGARHQKHRTNSRFGNQRPVDGIAKRLVHPHRILINGNALRQTKQRRTNIATILHIALQRIALRFIDEHASHVATQEIRQIQYTVVDSFGVRCLHVRRRLRIFETKRRHHFHHFQHWLGFVCEH